MKHCSIEAHDLTFAYPGAGPVLRNVSVRVQTGVVTGIIGPNGAGKSTLLQLLCGLLEPNEGEVRIDGHSLTSLSDPDRARRVAYMPQSVNPAFSLSVSEVVALGRFPHLGPFGILGETDHTVVRSCLEQTECAELATRDFLSLSGGERQRVLLASVLAQEPQLLLLDEPTSALDLPHEVAFFRQLRELKERGLGVVVVTHDINMAAQFCDELLLLGKGHQLVRHGVPAEVFVEEALTEAYGTPLRVGVHPDNGDPFVTVPLPETGS